MGRNLDLAGNGHYRKWEKLPVVGTILSAGFLLVSCGSEGGAIEEMAKTHNSFTLDEVVDQPISRAYVICEYSNTQSLVDLGFDLDDLHSIDRNAYAWESDTGIGFFYGEDEASYVEWFSPREMDACPGKIQSETEIDPYGVIEVTQEVRQPAGTDIEVTVLHLPLKSDT